MIVTLGELAAVDGMPSEPTLRKLIEANPDFPLISRGKNGQGYEIELAAAIAWHQGYRAREEEAARERSAEIRQQALDLLGHDAIAQPQVGLTPAERKALIEEEFAATRLARQRGELVKRNEIEIAVAGFVSRVAERMETLPQRLLRRAQLPRETVVALEEILRADRAAIADDFRVLATGEAGAGGSDDASATGDPAV